VYGADVVLKVRPPVLSHAGLPDGEVALLGRGSRLISFMWPAQNKVVVDQLVARGVTAFAMDQVPRITRAQVFDALSSMSNIAGCVLAAACTPCLLAT